MPEEIKPDETPKDETPVLKTDEKEPSKIWSWIQEQKKKIVGAFTVITIVGLSVFVGLKGHEKEYCFYNPVLSDTTCAVDSIDFVIKYDSLANIIKGMNQSAREAWEKTGNKVDYSKISAIAVSNGVLCATKGYTVPKMTGADTIAQPILDTIKTDVNTDSTRIAWYKKDAYTVEALKDMDCFIGKIDSTYAKAFRIDGAYDENGKWFKPLVVIDYKSMTYKWYGVKRGIKLDPAYSAIPIGATVGFFAGTSTDTALITQGAWYNGGETHGWFFNGIGADSSADSGSIPVALTYKGGATRGSGFNITAKACSLTADADTVWVGALSSLSSQDSIVVSLRLWMYDTTGTADAIFGNYLGTTSLLVSMFKAPDTIFFLLCNGSSAGGVAKFKVPSTMKIYNRITYSYDGSQTDDTGKVKIWFNGVQQILIYSATAFPTSTSATFGTAKFMIGNRLFGKHFRGKIDDFRMYTGQMRSSTQKRTNLFATIETVRKDTIKSTVAATANLRLKIAGQQIDSCWAFKATGDSVKDFSNGTNNITMNIYSLFTTQKLLSDTQKTDSTNIAQGRQIRYTRAVKDTADTTVFRVTYGNNIGKQNTYQEYRSAYVANYRETAKYETLYVPVIDSVRPAAINVAGGAARVYGHYFKATQGGGGVTFDGSAMNPITTWSTDSVTGTAPAKTVGTKNVIITNSDAQKDTATVVYFRIDSSRCCTVTVARGGYNVRLDSLLVDSVSTGTVRVRVYWEAIDSTIIGSGRKIFYDNRLRIGIGIGL